MILFLAAVHFIVELNQVLSTPLIANIRTARSCMPTKVSPEGKKYRLYAKIPDISVDFIFATAAIHFVNEGHRNAKLHAAMSTTALELHE